MPTVDSNCLRNETRTENCSNWKSENLEEDSLECPPALVRGKRPEGWGH